MSLGNRLLALGHWFEKHFPEKLTAEQVKLSFAIYTQALDKLNDTQVAQHEVIASLVSRVADLEKKAEAFNSDINKTKVMLLTQRQTR